MLELQSLNVCTVNNFWCVWLYSLFIEPEDFYADCTKLKTSPNGGVAVARGWSVKKLDPFERKAILENDYEITYEKCLIATGKVYSVRWIYFFSGCKCPLQYRIKWIQYVHTTYFGCFGNNSSMCTYLFAVLSWNDIYPYCSHYLNIFGSFCGRFVRYKMREAFFH